MVGTRWVFHNKMDEDDLRNEGRVVTKGYNQQEGINFYETYAHEEAIRVLSYFSSIMNYKLFQMDVKRIFLNGYIQ